MRVDVCVIQLQWVKHQEVGRLKEWQLVSVTTEIVSMYLSSFSISLVFNAKISSPYNKRGRT